MTPSENLPGVGCVLLILGIFLGFALTLAFALLMQANDYGWSCVEQANALNNSAWKESLTQTCDQIKPWWLK